MKKHEIMPKLYTMLQSRDAIERLTSVVVFELFATFLRVLFQPHVPELLPRLLTVCGTDPEPEVVKGADRALQSIEKTLTETTVRMILPTILATLRDNDVPARVRVKCCEVLGHSAHYGRLDVVSKMPLVVNCLLDVIGHINQSVSSAATLALAKVGSVIRNPDLLKVLPKIVPALSNPTSETLRGALTNLIATNFTHTLDAAGVTVLVPFLLRGLHDRDIEVNNTAAKVIGLLSSLIRDDRQIMAYLPRLLEVLKKHCIGPNPLVRASTAKAIGSLATLCDGGAGVALVNETMEWIRNFMNLPDVNDIEREGTAMAYAEILAAQGPEVLRDTHFPDILERCNNPVAGIRDGYLKLLVYLPLLMTGDQYESFLSESLSRALIGLSDEDEKVRDTCFEASSVMIRNFGILHLPMVLPVLLSGIQNEMWLTRFKCLRLLAQLLQKVSDEKAADNFSPDIYSLVCIDQRALVQELSQETVQEILAIVFVLQSDEVPNVKSQATVLWRSIVDVGNKQVVLEILPKLLDRLIKTLADEGSEERRNTAARACNMLVDRVGDEVVTRIVPILSEKIDSEVVGIRQGVCSGLTEIMRASTPRMLRPHTRVLIEVVKKAICDDVVEVQAAAAPVFNELTRFVGAGKVTKAIVRTLVDDLLAHHNPKQSLSGLSELIRSNGKVVLPALLPHLLVEDMTAIHLMSLGQIAKVSGFLLNEFLRDILARLVELLGAEESITNVLTAASPFSSHPLLFCISEVCCSLHDNEDGLDLFMEYVESVLENRRLPNVIRSGCALVVQMFCFGSDQQKPSPRSALMCIPELKIRLMRKLLVLLIGLFNNEDDLLVIRASFAAKHILEKLLTKDETGELIRTIRETVSRLFGPSTTDTSRAAELLRAFDLEVAFGAFLNVFQEGLRHGTSEVKEQSIMGIRDFIDLTSDRILQRYIVKFTGALLKYGVAAKQLPWQTKMVLITTLSKLIDKGGRRVHAFTSPMLTIFVKALQSTTAIVRNVAAEALGKVVALGRANIKKLVIELHNVIKGFRTTSLAYDVHTASVCTGVLRGLELVLVNRGEGIQNTFLREILETILTALIDPPEISNPEVVRSASNVAGVCYRLLQRDRPPVTQDDFVERTIRTQVLITRGGLKYCPEVMDANFTLDLLVKVATDAIQCPEPLQVQAVNLFLPFCLSDFEQSGGDHFAVVLDTLSQVTQLRQNVVRFHGVSVIKNIAKIANRKGLVSPDLLFPFVDLIYALAKDRHTPTKLMAERAMYHLFRMQGRNFSTVRMFFEMAEAAEIPDWDEEEKLRGLKAFCKRVERKGRDQDGTSDFEDEDDESPAAVSRRNDRLF